MKMSPRCMPCILNQIFRSAAELNLPRDEQASLLRRALAAFARLDPADIRINAPQLARRIFAPINKLRAGSDPFREIKAAQNQMVLQHWIWFRSLLQQEKDPLAKALHLALLGNAIDLGAAREFTRKDVFQGAVRKWRAPLAYKRFRRILAGAEKLLYIADNAGEAVLDALFIEEIKRFNPELKITVAVRSQPVANDVTLVEAVHAGLGNNSEIIKSGSTLAGIEFTRTTSRFRRAYREADLILAKGQGNFETMEEEADSRVFFAFMVKCAVVADYLGRQTGELVFASPEKGLFRKKNEGKS